MARLHVHLATPCRPEGARGQVLTRPIAALMSTDSGDGAAGPGWYESSFDLRRGLLVRESAADDRLLREWQEADRRLRALAPRRLGPATAEPALRAKSTTSATGAAARSASSARAAVHAGEHVADHRPGELLLADEHARAAVVRYPGGLDFVV